MMNEYYRNSRGTDDRDPYYGSFYAQSPYAPDPYFRDPRAVDNRYRNPYDEGAWQWQEEKREGFVRSVIFFRVLPILLILLSLSCLFTGWVRFSDNLKTDLNEITGYVSKTSSFLGKYAGIDSIGGIDTTELEEVIGILSDGELTPYEICTGVNTVQKASMELSQICDRLNIQSDSVDTLNSMAEGMAVFRLLCIILLGTAVLTILLILFRVKILGNWYFTAAAAALLICCVLLMNAVNQKMGTDYHISLTMFPFIAVILSLPLIPYKKKKQ